MRQIALLLAVLFVSTVVAKSPVFAFGTIPPANEAKVEAKATANETAPTPDTTQVNLTVPLFSPLFAKVPLASVNDEPILLQEFLDTIAASHGQMGEEKAAGKKNYEKVLRRLINIRLILLEAANMGIDELPEVQESVADYHGGHLRELLKNQAIKDVKPDDKLIEFLYREAVKEWKIRSLKFDKEEDAKELVKSLGAGGDFASLADKLIETGKAEGAKQGEFVQPQSLLPEIADALAPLKVGGVTPVIPIGPAFTVLKLEEIRYPEGNAEAREAAYAEALSKKKGAELVKYNETLTKKHAKINTKLLNSLNFESPKPGFAKMLKDQRVIASVKGEKPIVVADIAEAIRQKFFHGIDSAIKEKKVNVLIDQTFREKLYRLTFTREALSQGIDKTEKFKSDLDDYQKSMIFGAFVQKVVTPDIKLTEEEIQGYYQEHIEENSSPVMARLQGLVFSKREPAESAIEKLKKGTDLQWLRSNAEGQVDKEKGETLLEFTDKLLVLKDFPAPVQKLIVEAKPGEIRLYQSPEGFFYLLRLKDFFPAKPASLDKVRKDVNKKLFGVKLNESIEEWGERLKKEYKVKIFMTDFAK